MLFAAQEQIAGAGADGVIDHHGHGQVGRDAVELQACELFRARRFFEFNFGIPMGELSFADARSTTNLGNFYNLSSRPRAFQTIPASPFIAGVDDKLEPPDDD